MEFLFLFFILFGVGAILGLAYVGIKAIIMATRGSAALTKTVGGGLRQGWAQAKAEHEAAQLKKKERLRAQP
ncbi:hypothetical protein A3840_17380 [Devosia elaeis]|uniref:Uncharacterized protein n=2 Tax=Devosia elaeis TaxID=1770058 RepID=A0A178HP27_9HYPH|nr:hypothetical protein A3840_17380 [Devosia elaeis]